MVHSTLLPVLSNTTQHAATAVSLHPSKTLDQVVAALGELSAEHRLILCLHYYEELGFDEIASILEINRSKAEFLHRTALAELNARSGMVVQAPPAF